MTRADILERIHDAQCEHLPGGPEDPAQDEPCDACGLPEDECTCAAEDWGYNADEEDES